MSYPETEAVTTRPLSDNIQQCIRECNDCATDCTQAAHRGLVLGGRLASVDQQCLLRDCATVCGLVASFLARSSPYAARACRECVEICGRCASECEPMAETDEILRRCALSCRRCEQSCGIVADVEV